MAELSIIYHYFETLPRVRRATRKRAGNEKTKKIPPEKQLIFTPSFSLDASAKSDSRNNNTIIKDKGRAEKREEVKKKEQSEEEEEE